MMCERREKGGRVEGKCNPSANYGLVYSIIRGFVRGY